MNKKLTHFLYSWPRSYVSGVDLQNLLNKSSDSRHGVIKRAIKEGFLTPIRRDLYHIQLRNLMIDSFEVSGIIYGPSYVSFESALSYHQWIPEAVTITTCATTKRSKEFEPSIGIFSYEHIPVTAFPFGLEQHFKRESGFFIASPWKAIADMIYAQKRVWKNREALSQDLRIEPETLDQSDDNLLEALIKNYPSARVKEALKSLRKN